MTRKQIVLRDSTSAAYRRQPLLQSSSSSDDFPTRRLTVAEFAGGTTAECAAVACCCPCGIVKFLVLFVYKVPTGLCRKALRRGRHRRLVKKGILPSRRKCKCSEDGYSYKFEDGSFEVHPMSRQLAVLEEFGPEAEVVESKEVMELEKEMWDKFYAAGFWRSPSQRSDVSTSDENNFTIID